jgi:hypothetical protein
LTENFQFPFSEHVITVAKFEQLFLKINQEFVLIAIFELVDQLLDLVSFVIAESSLDLMLIALGSFDFEGEFWMLFLDLCRETADQMFEIKQEFLLQ